MTALPQIPAAQAPIAFLPAGTIAREWFVFLSALLAVIREQDARITALEAR